jgi:hypothetical protein
MCCETRWDMIRTDNTRERVGVSPIVKKMVETGLRWFEHVERRPIDFVVRIVDRMEDSQFTGGRG